MLLNKVSTDSGMIAYFIRRRLFVFSRVNVHIFPPREFLEFYKHYGKSSDGGSDPANDMLQLLQRRFFIPQDHHQAVSLLKGKTCAYGPLGVDLKRNLLEQWWSSLVRSRPQVFGISSLHGVGDKGAREEVEELLKQRDLTKEQLGERVLELIQRRPPFRTSLLQGG